MEGNVLAKSQSWDFNESIREGVGDQSWRRQWHPTPVLLPGKSHGWRSLVGCGPWGGEESVTTERLHFYFSLSCTGEENGNPLQCSCLENPRDRGAWWAALHGVAQSRTRLKRLSSSISSRGTSLAKLSGLTDVGVSCGCPNKVPQTEWLQTTEIYSLTVLEGSSPPESSCQRYHALSKSPGENLFHALLAFFLAMNP